MRERARITQLEHDLTTLREESQLQEEQHKDEVQALRQQRSNDAEHIATVESALAVARAAAPGWKLYARLQQARTEADIELAALTSKHEKTEQALQNAQELLAIARAEIARRGRKNRRALARMQKTKTPAPPAQEQEQEEAQEQEPAPPVIPAQQVSDPEPKTQGATKRLAPPARRN